MDDKLRAIQEEMLALASEIADHLLDAPDDFIIMTSKFSDGFDGPALWRMVDKYESVRKKYDDLIEKMTTDKLTK